MLPFPDPKPVSIHPLSTDQHSHSPADDTGGLDVPLHQAEYQLPHVSVSLCQPIPRVAAQSSANSAPAHLSQSPQHLSTPLDVPGNQSYSSPHLPTRLPQSQTLNQSHSISAPPSRIYHSQGMFTGSHHFSLQGNNTFIDMSSDNFMEKLLQHTIIGAEFDSSARDPPPRCHPGTRIAILQRCLDFVIECNGEAKLRWVVGPAGVGKSAVMQIVTEKAPDGVVCASVFLSINGRQDGTKIIVTIAYQLAVKCESYHQYIRNEITRDPSLLRKSLSAHFKRFIVEPFIHQRLFDAPRRFLVVVDGLDECDNPITQQNLLELISDFCITYPTSPIAWIVASRPEPHITSFFERVEVQPGFIQEGIMIDSDEACEDVQRYLRDELKKIKLEYASLRHKREWPSEHEFTQIASAAGGLFAYAATVVRYIGDPYFRNPTAQLHHVLGVIDGGPQSDMSGRDHPMAQLYALYARIFSTTQDDVAVDTRKLLLLCSSRGWAEATFRIQCNILGLTEGAAYAAICHLHAVLKVPEPDKADDESLEYFHKSLEDFLFDFQSFHFSHKIEDEIEQLKVQTILRIVAEVPDSIEDTGCEGIKCYDCGFLRGRSGFCDGISLSWPCDERLKTSDDELRCGLYRDLMLEICSNFRPDRNFYGSMSCFHFLTTRFKTLGPHFPLLPLHEAAFGKFRHELMSLGKLKQVPLRTLDYAAICGEIELRFASPIGMDLEPSHTWNPSCQHKKVGFDDVQHLRGWTTHFGGIDQGRPLGEEISDTEDDVAEGDLPRFNIVSHKESHNKLFSYFFFPKCDYCFRRFARHLTNHPDQTANVFVDSTEMCYVELSFVDEDDGVSEWRYRFLHSGPPVFVSC